MVVERHQQAIGSVILSIGRGCRTNGEGIGDEKREGKQINIPREDRVQVVVIVENFATINFDFCFPLPTFAKSTK